MNVLLLGSTDLTLAIASRVRDLNIPLVGIVSAPEVFKISYRPEGLTNHRAADLAGWCKENSVEHESYENPTSVLNFAQLVNADFALAVGWYHRIPIRVRKYFSKGCFGLHASLLPKFRGGAPLNWALLAGESETGVSLLELVETIDSGPICRQITFEIKPDSYIGDLLADAERASLQLIDSCLPAIAAGTMTLTPQEGEPTYCLARIPEDGLIDWSDSAENIMNLIRAASRPYPGAYSYLNGEKINIWRASIPRDSPSIFGRPGQIARLPEFDLPLVVTGSGSIVVEDAETAEGLSGLERIQKSWNMSFSR